MVRASLLTDKMAGGGCVVRSELVDLAVNRSGLIQEGFGPDIDIAR
jgi:hypothetical protein